MLKRLPCGKHLTLDQLPGGLRAVVRAQRVLHVRALIDYVASFRGARTVAMKDLLAAQGTSPLRTKASTTKPAPEDLSKYTYSEPLDDRRLRGFCWLRASFVEVY
jgi:hypothetical protein